MMMKLKSVMNRNPLLSLLVLMVIFAPKQASAVTFVSTALQDSKAQVVIQILGGIAMAMTLGNIAQGFFKGSSEGWLSQGIGLVCGLVLVIQPSLLGTTLASMGM